MTEPKSPREIAEDTPRGKALGVVHWYARIQQTPRVPYAQELADAIEQALIAHAADLVEALDSVAYRHSWASQWINGGWQCLFCSGIAEQAKDVIHKPDCYLASRLSSRPATEGKREDE